jgi:hypothetical protein
MQVFITINPHGHFNDRNIYIIGIFQQAMFHYQNPHPMFRIPMAQASHEAAVIAPDLAMVSH